MNRIGFVSGQRRTNHGYEIKDEQIVPGERFRLADDGRIYNLVQLSSRLGGRDILPEFLMLTTHPVDGFCGIQYAGSPPGGSSIHVSTLKDLYEAY